MGGTVANRGIVLLGGSLDQRRLPFPQHLRSRTRFVFRDFHASRHAPQLDDFAGNELLQVA